MRVEEAEESGCEPTFDSWEEPQAAKPVMKAVVAMTAEIRLKDLFISNLFFFPQLSTAARKLHLSFSGT